ncbi:MAG: flavodoxin family protein [Proteocatella sp.]
MMKKIIVINASPRKNKNTEQLSQYILEKIDYMSFQTSDEVEVKYLDLKKMDFIGCIDCGYCQKHKGCSIKDDLHNIYEQFDNSCATIIITPVYFDGTPWKLKALVDRMQAIYNSKYILNDSLIDRNKLRKGMLISLGGAPLYDTQFIGNQLVMNFMFKSVNTNFEKHLKVSGTDEVSAIKNQYILDEIDNFLMEVILEV